MAQPFRGCALVTSGQAQGALGDRMPDDGYLCLTYFQYAGVASAGYCAVPHALAASSEAGQAGNRAGGLLWGIGPGTSFDQPCWARGGSPKEKEIK
jgi:hypothetical protein